MIRARPVTRERRRRDGKRERVLLQIGRKTYYLTLREVRQLLRTLAIAIWRVEMRRGGQR